MPTDPSDNIQLPPQRDQLAEGMAANAALQAQAQDIHLHTPDPASTPKGGVRMDQAVTPAAKQQPVRSLDSVEAAITGAASSTQKAPLAVDESRGPPMQPHEFDMKNWDDLDKLKAAAKAGGIDVDKLPEGTLEQIKMLYAHAHYPGVIDTAQHWVQATGAGAFLRGWDDGAPSDTIPLSELQKISPQMAEQRKAFQFFGANIMQRIIEEGKYIKTSPDGTSTAYVPPDEYKAGKVIGSVLANPGSVAGIPKMAQVGLAATMQGMGKVAQSFQQLAQTYPAAANLVAGVGKWGAIGFLWKNMHEL